MNRFTGRFRRLGALAVPFLALAATYGLDLWHRNLARIAAEDFHFIPVIWGGLLANLAFGLLMIGTAWLMLLRRRQDLALAAAYLIAGFVVTLVPLSLLLPTPASLPLLGASFFQPIRVAILDFGISSRVALAAILIAVLGVLGLIVPPQSMESSA